MLSFTVTWNETLPVDVGVPPKVSEPLAFVTDRPLVNVATHP